MLTLVVRLGIRQCNCGLCHPEHTSRDATKRRSKKHEPFSSKPVVGVKSGSVGSITHCSKHERPLDTDLFNDHTTEEARHHHQAEGESVGSIHEIWLLFTSCSQRVHSWPSLAHGKTIAHSIGTYHPRFQGPKNYRYPRRSHCNRSLDTILLD